MFAHKYANVCLVYITYISTEDFCHGILTVIMVISIRFLIECRGHLFVSENIFNHYIFKKNLKNCRKTREDTMTKIIVTPIRNINETFIDIFKDLSLAYNVFYYHGHD